MSFNSFLYLIYLPLSVLIYWLLPFKFRKYFLLFASYLFYSWSEPRLLILLFASSLVIYFGALGSGTSKKGRKTFSLVLSLILLLGSLFTFKYLDFFWASLSQGIYQMSGRDIYRPISLFLPIGISFYTFQGISYIADVYNGKKEAEKDPVTVFLFLSYFPQLVAGPIEKSSDLFPQLKEKKTFSLRYILNALPYLLKGYLKKVLIADTFGRYVDSVNSNVSTSSGASLLLATFFFAFQIYGDFSGYCDIAKGSSELLGIELSENFKKPYLSTSLRDFYRRWHVSLNRFFLDDVYIPLGGSRKGKPVQILLVLFVFFLSGLWHGASWHYVLWGALSGLLISIEILLEPLKKRFLLKTHLPRCFLYGVAVFFTFLMVSFLWIFFRADSTQTAFTVIQKIFTEFAPLKVNPLWEEGTYVFLVFASLILLPLTDIFPPLKEQNLLSVKEKERISPPKALLYLSLGVFVLFAGLLNLETHGSNGFIYFQF